MIQILVDSAADFSKEEIEAKHFTFVPLQVMLNGQTYQDGVNLFRNDFYEMLISSDDFPKTSQPSPQAFVEIFEKAKANQDSVLCILLSSALSGTYQSAKLAKDVYKRQCIYHVVLLWTMKMNVLFNSFFKN